jgi:hypothetical protein
MSGKRKVKNDVGGGMAPPMKKSILKDKVTLLLD